MEPLAPHPEAVRAQLARVLAAAEFKRAPRLGEFLAFVVSESLAGRVGTIKEYSIGVSVYRKGPSYDPRLDATVRVEARKLRIRLNAYYDDGGRDDALCISIPKGSYVPRFDYRTLSSADPQNQHLPSIAVLPFLNLSSDPDNSYFSDGLMEDLAAALTRTSLMRVVSRRAASRFRGTGADLLEIGRTLNVERVLEGSVRKSGDRLRITVQLVNISDGCQLWSKTYDRTLPDIFAIQEAIADEVVLCVCGTRVRDSANTPSRHTPNAEACDLYIRGRHALDRWNAQSERDAIRYFEQAITLDPQYPLPYVGLARAGDCLTTMGVVPPSEVLPTAKAALEKALELDPDFAEARLARATWIARHEWDWGAAEQDFRLVLESAPMLAQAHSDFATEYLAPNGHFEEAIAETRRARELDPFSPSVASAYAWVLLFQRRFSESEREFRALLAGGPDYAGQRSGLAFALLGQHRWRESVEEYSLLAATDTSPANECVLAWFWPLPVPRTKPEAV